MLKKINALFVLVGLLFLVCPLYAQDTQTDVALKIKELELKIAEQNKQIQELKIKNGEQEKEITELKIKLFSVDYEHFDLELKGSLLKWGLIILLAVLTLFSLIGLHFIKDRVDKKIEGEQGKFKKAVRDIKALREEIKLTEDRVSEWVLAGLPVNKDLAKRFPLKFFVNALKKAEPNEVFIIQSAIEGLGLKEYSDEVQANEIVQLVSKYLNFTHRGHGKATLYIAARTLAKIGTQEACDRLRKFGETEEGKPVFHAMLRDISTPDEEHQNTQEVAKLIEDSKAE